MLTWDNHRGLAAHRECAVKRFTEGAPSTQSVLFPERLDEWIAEDNPIRAIDAFVDELDLRDLGFESAEPSETGRPAYHPGTVLKIYIYGYLNRVQSSSRVVGSSARRSATWS
jgi:transposase